MQKGDRFMNNLINEARHIPVNGATTTLSISPVTLPAPGRGLPLEMRITAPATGRDLPVILLSHGHGPSLYLPSKDGYGPIVNFYAEHGFVVIQPTHANSKVAGLDPKAPGGPLFWRSRVEDMKLILDQLEEIEASVPAIAGRLDRKRVAAVGHSMGGQTVGMLLGARLTDPKDENATDVNMIEPRIKAGVLLAAPGNGGDSLSEFARENYTALNPDYTHMTTRTLVVAGDSDVNPHLTVRGADWHADPYHHGPGSDCLLTLTGGKHGLGGIAGYDAKETDDEDPDRLAVTLRMTWAYLRSALYDGDLAWPQACKALEDHAGAHGRVESK
jgi:predicted dienelactone hydrolase